MRLDKSVFAKQSLSQACNHQEHYRNMSGEEQARSFHYLMSVAYGFVGKKWPRMDKSSFQTRKQK